MTIIEAIRYFKKTGEFIITEKDIATGETTKTHSNNLTKNEREWARSSKDCFETAICVCWIN